MLQGRLEGLQGQCLQETDLQVDGLLCMIHPHCRVPFTPVGAGLLECRALDAAERPVHWEALERREVILSHLVCTPFRHVHLLLEI